MSHLIQTRGLMRSSTSTSNLQQIVVMIQSNGSALQLFDSQSICTLLLLYLLDQDKFNIVRLQGKIFKILMGTCELSQTDIFTLP